MVDFQRLENYFRRSVTVNVYQKTIVHSTNFTVVGFGMFHLSHRGSLSFFEHTWSLFTVRNFTKSMLSKNQSQQFATPGHVIYAYNKGPRCLSLLVWLLGFMYLVHSLVLKTSVARFVAMGLRSHFNSLRRRA